MTELEAMLYKAERRIIKHRKEARRIFGVRHEDYWDSEYRDRLRRLKERARRIRDRMNAAKEADAA